MESNKVNVKIYGQEYVIAGEKSREHILKVADYVDRTMHEVERALRGGSPSSLAVLAAANAADEYFSLEETLTELRKTNAELERDVQHYVKMWEEAKRSFQKYKEDVENSTKQKENLQELLAEKDCEASVAKEKMREVENNYFDLQMENVQLKSELERFKKINV